MPLKVPAPGPSLTFTVAEDSDAARVSAVLTALGYDPKRVIPASQWSEVAARVSAVQRLAALYDLTQRETAYVHGVLEDMSEDELVRTQGGSTTIQSPQRMLKWVRRSTLAKCDCADAAELRAKVESLQDVRGSDVEAKAAQLDELCALLGCEASDRPVEKVRSILRELEWAGSALVPH